MEAKIDSSKDKLFGPVVYRNCCGFLQIRPNAAMESLSSTSAHPLDETRIHPDSYANVLEIVHSALELEDDKLQEETETAVAKALRKADKHGGHDDDDEDEEKGDEEERDEEDEEMMSDEQRTRKADKKAKREAKIRARVQHELNVKHITAAMSPKGISSIHELDLEVSFKEQIENAHMWVRELAQPFADYKRMLTPFAPPSQAQLFYLLSGESSRTLREGMVLSVVINGIHPAGKGAYVRLDNGIRGFLSLRNVSDSAPQGGNNRWMRQSRRER